MVFEDIYQTMEEMGTFELLLPFLLVFILVYAILEKVKLFGEKSTAYNLILAAVVGILLVRQGDLVELINTFIPNVSLVVVVFFGILVIAGLFGFGSTSFKGGVMIFFVIISLIGGIWALVQAAEYGEFEYTLPFIDKDIEITETDAGIAVVLAVIILIVGVAAWRPRKRGYEGFMDAMSKMGDTFAGYQR